MPLRRAVLVCLTLALGVCAAAPKPGKLFKEARKAEREGDVVRAYLLYAHAAALDPSRPDYWARSQALRTKAALEAGVLPRAVQVEEPSSEEPEAEEFHLASAEDLEELRRLRPPPELKPSSESKTFDLRGDAKALFEKVAGEFGLEAVFDADYQPGPPVRLRLEEAGCEQAIRALEAATSSFVVPLGERLFLVAKDTPQKRAEVEPTVAVSIQMPYTVTPQEAQELARAVQQTLEIQKLTVDSSRHMVIVRDRISKVRPAQLLLEQMARGRAQVSIEMRFLEIDRSALLSYGLLTPTQFPIVYAGRDLVQGATQSLAKFLFGRTIFGIGIADAQLFATMSRSTSRILLESQMRSVAGQPAAFHVGDKFPVVTGGFLGDNLGIPPTFNFEDLGLSLKVTPYVHGTEEISMDLEADFKVLAGQSVNGIPIIANRQFQSKVRLRTGDWAMVAGLMSTSEARSVSGLAGLASLPVLGALFRQNDRTEISTEVVILVKAVLLDLPPGATSVTHPLHIGSDGRMKIPL